jgi:uncharacterized Zn-binding protein involved in type VI secretion
LADEAPKEKTPEEIQKELDAQASAKAAFEAALPVGLGPFAARVLDNHACPMVSGLVPHVGGPITTGQPNVLIANMPAARSTDLCTCAGGPDMNARGSATVLIGGLPAARLLDQTGHGGAIVTGAPTVMIGG